MNKDDSKIAKLYVMLIVCYAGIFILGYFIYLGIVKPELLGLLVDDKVMLNRSRVCLTLAWFVYIIGAFVISGQLKRIELEKRSQMGNDGGRDISIESEMSSVWNDEGNRTNSDDRELVGLKNRRKDS